MATPSVLVLHPSTELRLKGLAKNLPHGLLLSGKPGVGLMSAARQLSREIGYETHVVLPERQEVVDIEKGTITVKSIRQLYTQTRTKTNGRIIIIDYAERMGAAAQNAFLKLLEEPTPHAHFILLSHQPRHLLPTVLSRVQEVEIKPITRGQSEVFLDTLGVKDKTRRTQLLFIAEGLPAELSRLQDEEAFKARSATVQDARVFITGAPYARLLIAQSYKDNREQALLLLEDALKQLRMTATNTKDTGTLKTINQVLVAYDRIAANGNIRLQLATAL